MYVNVQCPNWFCNFTARPSCSYQVVEIVRCRRHWLIKQRRESGRQVESGREWQRVAESGRQVENGACWECVSLVDDSRAPVETVTEELLNPLGRVGVTPATQRQTCAGEEWETEGGNGNGEGTERMEENNEHKRVMDEGQMRSVSIAVLITLHLIGSVILELGETQLIFTIKYWTDITTLTKLPYTILRNLLINKATN